MTLLGVNNMHNHLKVLILSILILLTLFIIYMIINIPNSKKTLQIKPIQIEPIKIVPLDVTTKNSVEEEQLSLRPIDILSKLKTASEASKEAIVSSQKEQSSDIVKSLIKKIEKELVEKVAIQKVPKEIKTIKKKPIIKKNSTPIKTFITSKKELSQQKAKQNQKYKKLNQEKELVNVSNSFEIKEENTLPDSHYFEPIKNLKNIENNAPLEFVKKLGVVTISDEYESNFIIPKKTELAKEGIVNFSSTSIETEELKKLEFVDTLGIIEVSEEFETINAKKYLD